MVEFNQRADYLARFAPVKSADRVIDIVHLLAVEPLSFEDIARRLSLPRSSLHGLLTTLERRGWVKRSGKARAAGNAYHVPEPLVRGLLDAARHEDGPS